MRIRRYAVKYATTSAGRYSVKTREFNSLRGAGEWVQGFSDQGYEFLEIRALEVSPLTSQEKEAFTFFTDGRIVFRDLRKKR